MPAKFQSDTINMTPSLQEIRKTSYLLINP